MLAGWPLLIAAIMWGTGWLLVNLANFIKPDLIPTTHSAYFAAGAIVCIIRGAGNNSKGDK